MTSSRSRSFGIFGYGKWGDEEIMPRVPGHLGRTEADFPGVMRANSRRTLPRTPFPATCRCRWGLRDQSELCTSRRPLAQSPLRIELATYGLRAHGRADRDSSPRPSPSRTRPSRSGDREKCHARSARRSSPGRQSCSAHQTADLYARCHRRAREKGLRTASGCR